MYVQGMSYIPSYGRTICVPSYHFLVLKNVEIIASCIRAIEYDCLEPNPIDASAFVKEHIEGRLYSAGHKRRMVHLAMKKQRLKALWLVLTQPYG